MECDSCSSEEEVERDGDMLLCIACRQALALDRLAMNPDEAIRLVWGELEDDDALFPGGNEYRFRVASR